MEEGRGTSKYYFIVKIESQLSEKEKEERNEDGSKEEN